MKVIFNRDVQLEGESWAEGQIAYIHRDVYQILLGEGAVSPAPLIKEESGEDITTPEDGSDGEPPDDSVSKDAPKGRGNRRNK
jgi:hypothetical protein